MSEALDFPIAPDADVSPGPAGFALNTRGERGAERLQERFGRAVWDGGDGAPELNREGHDPRRPWM